MEFGHFSVETTSEDARDKDVVERVVKLANYKQVSLYGLGVFYVLFIFLHFVGCYQDHNAVTICRMGTTFLFKYLYTNNRFN